MFSHCEAVIFDCDGVLVDSEYLCHLALAIALADLGIEEDADALHREFGGVELQRIFAAMEQRHARRLPPDFEAGYRKVVADLFEQRLRAVEGVEAVIRSLDIPYCVASNGPRVKMEHSLGLTGLREYFDERLYSAYDVGAWKPDPELFLTAARGMGVQADRCLVVEDSLVGVKAAQAAGMSVVHFRVEQTQSPADVPVLTHMQDLPALLGVPRSRGAI